MASEQVGSTRAGRVRAVLEAAFAPALVEVHDDSARHAGHSGAAPGGETHIDVLVVSGAFEGRSRVERARAVHAVLDEEFRGGLHALGLSLRTPGEAAKTGLGAGVKPRVTES